MQQRRTTISSFLEKHKEQIGKALPSHIKLERLIRVALTSISKNPKLLECDERSLFAAILQSAQLGLEPDGALGQAYLIPYGNSCNFQIGYKGLLQLVRRGGNVSMVNAQIVYEGDSFEYDLAFGIKSHKDTEKRDLSKPKYVYCIIQYKDGGFDFDVWTVKKIQEHMVQYSKGYAKQDSPWKTNWESMAKKTMIIQVAKKAELSPEIQKAISLDEKAERGENQMNLSDIAPIVDKEEFKEAAYAEVIEEESKKQEEKQEVQQQKAEDKATSSLNKLKKDPTPPTA